MKLDEATADADCRVWMERSVTVLSGGQLECSERESAELFTRIRKQASLCCNALLADAKALPAATAVSLLVSVVSEAFFQGVSASALRAVLRSHVTAVFAAAGKRKFSPSLVSSEDWVSQLAVLAYHVLLVQTRYGISLPATPVREECLALDGMKEAEQMLLHHGVMSRQPERFIEGLMVLHFCGNDTSTMLLQWAGNMSTAPSVGPLSIYPKVLQRTMQQAAEPAALSTAAQLADVLHWCIVLLMYSAAVGLRMEHICSVTPVTSTPLQQQQALLPLTAEQPPTARALFEALQHALALTHEPTSEQSDVLLRHRKPTADEPATPELLQTAALGACADNELLLYHSRTAGQPMLQQPEAVTLTSDTFLTHNNPKKAAAALSPDSRVGPYFQISLNLRKQHAPWMKGVDETVGQPFGESELCADALFAFNGRGPISESRLHYDNGGGVVFGIRGRKLWVAVNGAEAEQQGLTSEAQRFERKLDVQRHSLGSWLKCKSFCWFVMGPDVSLFLPNSDWLHATYPLDDQPTVSQGTYALLLPALPQQVISWLRQQKSLEGPFAADTNKSHRDTFAAFMLQLAQRVQPDKLAQRTAAVRESYAAALGKHRAELTKLLGGMSAGHVHVQLQLRSLVQAMLAAVDRIGSANAAAASAPAAVSAAPPRLLRTGTGAAVDPHRDRVTFFSTRNMSDASTAPFRGRRFLLDYPGAGSATDTLGLLLRQLEATVITELQRPSDQLVIGSQLQQKLNTSVQRSRHTRIAKWQLQQKGADTLPDRREQACSMQCAVLNYNELLLSAQRRRAVEVNAVPCIIIGDAAGMYKADVVVFPMVEARHSASSRHCTVSSRTHHKHSAAAAASPALAATAAPSTAPVKRVHTLPCIDWDAPPGRSPFVTGLQRSEDVARAHRAQEQRNELAQAVKAGHVDPKRIKELQLAQLTANSASAASGSKPAPLPAPRLLWCEVCRKHCESEQAHHNNPEHQKRYDCYEQQLRPLIEEMETQRIWNRKNHFMHLALQKIAARKELAAAAAAQATAFAASAVTLRALPGQAAAAAQPCSVPVDIR